MVVQGIPLTTVVSCASQRQGAVDADAGLAAVRRDGHVDGRRGGRDEAVEGGGGAVREHRAGSTGEHGGHEAAVTAEERRRDEAVDARGGCGAVVRVWRALGAARRGEAERGELGDGETARAGEAARAADLGV